MTKGLDFLVEHEVAIRRLCRRYGPRLEEDLWDVAVDHIDGVLARYDASYGVPLKRYVMDRLRRYTLKGLTRINRLASRTEPLYDEHASSGSTEAILEYDDRDQVYSLMDKLSAYDRRLLVLHLVLGKSFAEIAGLLGCAVGTAYGHYKLALSRARSRAEASAEASKDKDHE